MTEGGPPRSPDEATGPAPGCATDLRIPPETLDASVPPRERASQAGVATAKMVRPLPPARWRTNHPASCPERSSSDQQDQKQNRRPCQDSVGVHGQERRRKRNAPP